MTFRSLRITPILAVAAMLGACAADGSAPNLFSTASVAPADETKPVKVAKVDPACVTLASQIDGLRKEGSIDRLEKVAAGKGANVQVKRATLAKQAELNKANADFQAKCAPRLPSTQDAAAPAVPAVQQQAMAAAAPKVAAKAATSGVTVATPPTAKTQ